MGISLRAFFCIGIHRKGISAADALGPEEERENAYTSTPTPAYTMSPEGEASRDVIALFDRDEFLNLAAKKFTFDCTQGDSVKQREDSKTAQL